MRESVLAQYNCTVRVKSSHNEVCERKDLTCTLSCHWCVWEEQLTYAVARLKRAIIQVLVVVDGANKKGLETQLKRAIILVLKNWLFLKKGLLHHTSYFMAQYLETVQTSCTSVVWTVSTGNFAISLLEETLFISQLSSTVTFFYMLGSWVTKGYLCKTKCWSHLYLLSLSAIKSEKIDDFFLVWKTCML